MNGETISGRVARRRRAHIRDTIIAAVWISIAAIIIGTCITGVIVAVIGAVRG